MGVGNRIRAGIGSKYPLLKDFCADTGVSYRTLQHYLSEKRGVSTDFLTLLSEQIGVSATWILTGKGSMFIKDDDQIVPNRVLEFIPIPRLDVTASAGHGSLVESEDGSGAYAFSRKWLARRGLNPDRLAVIAVSGDSMEPDLHDGDLILVNRADTTLRDGRLYVVQYSGALFVKSVQFFPGKRLCLNSRNPNHAPISIDQGENDQVKIIGRVVASMHEW